MSLELFSFFNQLSVVLISFSSLFLAFWVYLVDRKSKINQSFCWLAIFIFLWLVFSFWGNASTDPEFATSLGRLAYGSVALLLIPFYYFPILFLKEEKRYSLLNISVVVSNLILFFVSVFTELIVAGMDFTGLGAIPVLGKWKLIYFSVLTFVILFIASRFLVNYFRFSKKEKLQTQYFLVGFFSWILVNLIFNIILPVFQKTPQYWALGNYSTIFLLGFTAFAIVRRNLFNIKVVLTQIFVVLIALLLLVNFLTSQSIFEYLWKGILFLLFVVFGVLLVKSVQKEIKQREELERQKEELDMLATKVAIANIKLEGANAQLKTLDAAKSEFISIASHQLRSPLTAIKGYISMLIEGDYGKMPLKALKPIENVYASSERLIMLVNSLLSISRLESGKITMEYSDVDLAEIIEDVIREMKIEAERHKIKLIFEPPEDKIILKLDKEKIRNVVLNLIDNAIKYTVKGSVEASFIIDGQNVRLIIQDTGAGLNSEEIERLFESFSRAGAGQRFWVEGVGLGLYIARKFVEMHNGRIWAESEGKGKGSRFIVELPIVKNN